MLTYLIIVQMLLANIKRHITEFLSSEPRCPIQSNIAVSVQRFHTLRILLTPLQLHRRRKRSTRKRAQQTYKYTNSHSQRIARLFQKTHEIKRAIFKEYFLDDVSVFWQIL